MVAINEHIKERFEAAASVVATFVAGIETVVRQAAQGIEGVLPFAGYPFNWNHDTYTGFKSVGDEIGV